MSLELSCNDTYEQVSSRVASALTPPLDDPSKIRFTQQNNYTQQPKPQHLRFPQQELLLPDMLSQHFGQSTDTLYYEVLDLPLQELERLKTLKVSNSVSTGCLLYQVYHIKQVALIGLSYVLLRAQFDSKGVLSHAGACSLLTA